MIWSISEQEMNSINVDMNSVNVDKWSTDCDQPIPSNNISVNDVSFSVTYQKLVNYKKIRFFKVNFRAR